MSHRWKIVLYILLVIIIIGSIFIIWAYDTGRFSSSADISISSVDSAQELTSLPSPDKSTFSDIFGKVIDWFSRQ